MTMKIADPENEGQEIEVFTAEEMNAQKAEAESARAEADRLQKVSAEKTENFKKLNEMTEQERASLSAEKIENLKRMEAAEAKASALEQKMNEENEKRVTNTKEEILARYHGGNAELKKVLEDNYNLIQLEGNDTATIQQRADLAVSMEIGKNNANRNPLTAVVSGGAPAFREKGATNFTETDKGKAALAQMGD